MRPTHPCARCIRDLTPGCEHLANTYDRALLKGMDEQQIMEYGLNRMLALDRDNGNKAEGLKAARTYKSRNTKTSESLGGRCGILQNGRGPLRCMRPIGHEYEDDRGHKF